MNMIRSKTIESTSWVAITSAGKQGSCWIYKNKKGTGGVVITHSDSGSAPSGRIGFRLWKPTDNTNVCILGPDNVNDIFYARTIIARDKIILAVDVS
jgi:hypothetical protein